MTDQRRIEEKKEEAMEQETRRVNFGPAFPSDAELAVLLLNW